MNDTARGAVAWGIWALLSAAWLYLVRRDCK